ncbi:hypothetical protein Ngar_c12480 [Candidatus Nitrososphaera gargensis Ga9.2]|uniref:Uncharacterized protein n=1 Tax=Nitrososphaera gargensis (strain Ga9.2) TaxID=1237085 RepID=K0IH70_NITGG|nr:hypothetical protein [Candidatus Nitrososphaera gargensis]AFU58188.1 hypothetical protein Ngar_c12480 [Candidatus Nitrososphaera gargensis Ga9.2]
MKLATKETPVFQEGIVAYLDILGFSRKKDEDEVDRCFTDFPNPLIYAAKIFDKVRFSMFSDCAVLAADQKDAADLIATIRSAFRNWSFDGILVRGSICLGTYVERKSIFYETAPPNFRGVYHFGYWPCKSCEAGRKEASRVAFHRR